MMPNHNPQHREDKTAKMLEEQTAKIPTDVYLWAAPWPFQVKYYSQLRK